MLCDVPRVPDYKILHLSVINVHFASAKHVRNQRDEPMDISCYAMLQPRVPDCKVLRLSVTNVHFASARQVHNQRQDQRGLCAELFFDLPAGVHRLGVWALATDHTPQAAKPTHTLIPIGQHPKNKL